MESDFYDNLSKVRQYIHANPEISNKEFQTTQFLQRQLEALDINILDLPLTTGLVAEIGQGYPIIALRADIDALPIVEKNTFSYASQNGAMHACGHDFHQTSLLGAAQLLKARESELRGRLRLIFQPAEEVATGAYAMIAAGALEDVSAIIGYHNMPFLKPGQIGLRSKAIMAAVEKFKVCVTGVSGHAARPDLGVDTVLTITTMVNNLQAIVSRQVSPFEPTVLSVTHIEVGSAWNIMPHQGFFEGTIRSFTPDNRIFLRQKFTQIVEQTAQQFGAEVDIQWDQTPNVTYNDEILTPLIAENSKSFAEVIEVAPVTGGEDFAAYQEKIPGVFAFIGANGDPDAPDLHHDTFKVKDEALPIAVKYYVNNAEMLLAYFGDKEKLSR